MKGEKIVVVFETRGMVSEVMMTRERGGRWRLREVTTTNGQTVERVVYGELL